MQNRSKLRLLPMEHRLDSIVADIRSMCDKVAESEADPGYGFQTPAGQASKPKFTTKRPRK